MITGGATGIGHEVVTRLHAQGSRCAVLDLDEPDDLPDGSLSLRCDIADPAAVSRAGDAIRNEFGTDPGILVHCAALQGVGPFADVTLEHWHRTMRINVDGAFHLLRTFLPAMRAAGWGRVVMVTSSTLMRPPPNMVPYVTSKGALQGLVHALAAEVGGDGVTVNAVAPGLTRTPHAVAHVPEAQFADLISRQAVKRSGEPADSASAIVYLTSAEASFITGQTLLVDGGESFT